MKEVWKSIKGYEGIYEVSNLGRVRSLDRYVELNGGLRKYDGIVLKQKSDKNGRKSLYLFNQGKGKYYQVHRIVAEAFIPNPENKPTVDHIDTNPSNNRVDNLRWATQKEQMHNPITKKKWDRWAHSTDNINHCREINKLSIKSCRKPVLCIETGEVFPSIVEVVRKTGCYVQDCLVNKNPVEDYTGSMYYE